MTSFMAPFLSSAGEVKNEGRDHSKLSQYFQIINRKRRDAGPPASKSRAPFLWTPAVSGGKMAA